jgi:hypothetical protein
MKKKSASQSAFFNLRVLIGLFMVLAGVFLALLGFGTFSAQAQQKQTSTQSVNLIPLLPPGFDCSQISALGIDRQDNLRAGAIMIACGQAQGGSASPATAFSQFVQSLLPSPLAYGTTDVNLITGTDSGSHITQSETFVGANPDNPNEIVVAYNDSRGVFANPINISGASVSTDGGTTFTRLTAANGQSPFQNTFGDPVMLYNSNLGTWFAIFLDAACGGQGVGGYKSTNPSDPTSWSHFCVHNGGSDDRESAWVDNTSSTFAGRMYVSWNNFAVGGGAIFVRFSDNGTTWTERQITNNFIRDVQLTGDLGGSGHVYLAAMNEMGGGLTNRANLFYRSTDGGNSWSLVNTGPTFAGPGVRTCPNSYFACMFTDNNGTWRHMGWGQPAALNGKVHYVYASRRTGDAGDVFYVRSTDNGNTFSAPLKLNTDTTTRPQWQPNLSAATDGSLLAVWYDARESAACANANPAVPCYRMWARKSTDEGATWLADMEFSDVVTPLPGQQDPGIIAEYRGDYDYSYQLAAQHLHPWVDGRVTVSGQSQQNTFFDQEGGGGGGGIPCGDLVSFQVRCKHGAGGDKLQAKVTLTDMSHSGEQVTITVDGNPNSVTINGNKATLQINNEPLGQHTVELTDPAGCFAPVITNCN